MHGPRAEGRALAECVDRRCRCRAPIGRSLRQLRLGRGQATWPTERIEKVAQGQVSAVVDIGMPADLRLDHDEVSREPGREPPPELLGLGGRFDLDGGSHRCLYRLYARALRPRDHPVREAHLFGVAENGYGRRGPLVPHRW